MKRYLIAGLLFAALIIVLLWWHANQTGQSSAPPSVAATEQRQILPHSLGSNAFPVKAPPTTTNGVPQDDRALAESPAASQAYNERVNTPIAFYCLVVDQDSNALANVVVDLDIFELYRQPGSQAEHKRTPIQRQTGSDGRFEIIGPKANIVVVNRFAREGYEPELMQRQYGSYGATSTSFDHPAVLTMWSTNIHEQLIGGYKSFVVIPDGRHYAIDLVEGTIAEGDNGDLVAWIKRPESVKWGQRYDWSCEMRMPSGGLLEDSRDAMFKAPELGYTNMFTRQQEAGSHWWGVTTGDKRFYVKLRDGQMYGRITINLYANYHGKEPGMIQLSYTVNPSGSRILR